MKYNCWVTVVNFWEIICRSWYYSDIKKQTIAAFKRHCTISTHPFFWYLTFILLIFITEYQRFIIYHNLVQGTSMVFFFFKFYTNFQLSTIWHQKKTCCDPCTRYASQDNIFHARNITLYSVIPFNLEVTLFANTEAALCFKKSQCEKITTSF